MATVLAAWADQEASEQLEGLTTASACEWDPLNCVVHDARQNLRTTVRRGFGCRLRFLFWCWKVSVSQTMMRGGRVGAGRPVECTPCFCQWSSFAGISLAQLTAIMWKMVKTVNGHIETRGGGAGHEGRHRRANPNRGKSGTLGSASVLASFARDRGRRECQGQMQKGPEMRHHARVGCDMCAASDETLVWRAANQEAIWKREAGCGWRSAECRRRCGRAGRIMGALSDAAIMIRCSQACRALITSIKDSVRTSNRVIIVLSSSKLLFLICREFLYPDTSLADSLTAKSVPTNFAQVLKFHFGVPTWDSTPGSIELLGEDILIFAHCTPADE